MTTLTPAEQTVLALLAAHPRARLRVSKGGADIVRLNLTEAAVHSLWQERGVLLLYREHITTDYVLNPETYQR